MTFQGRRRNGVTIPPTALVRVMLAGWLLCGAIADAAPDARALAEGEALLRAGDVIGALAATERAVAADPRDLDARELYFDLLVALGRGGQAKTELEALEAAHPDDPDVRYLVGRAATDPRASALAYDAALSLDPHHARATMGIASLQEAAARWSAAETGYAAAVEADPGLSEAWLGRIRCLLRMSRHGEALDVARAAVARVPGEPALVLVVAELAPKEAKAVLEAALRRMPDEPRLRSALAARLLAAGDTAGAAREAKAALQRDPDSAEASRTLLFATEAASGALDARGREALDAALARGPVDPAGAMAEFKRLAGEYPRSALVRLALGSARRAAGDPAGLSDLVAAAQLDPLNVDATGAAGLALLEAGRDTEAEPLLAAAYAQRPWDPALGLGRIRILSASGRSSEALSLSAELAERFPRDPGVQVTRSGLLLDAGRAEEAYQLLSLALVVAPDPRVVAAFIRIAPLAGHPAEAAVILDRIVAATGNPELAKAAAALRK